MLNGIFRTLRDAARERFVSPHYQAFVRQDGGPEQRVLLPRGSVLDREFVADPFLFAHTGEDYLFFEGMYANRGSRGRNKGVIGCLKRLADSWVDCGVVLEEPWHLSFPNVFEVDGRVYMIPESGQSGAVSLYTCDHFPSRWTKQCDLIKGDCNYVDATIVREDGVFYLVVTPAEAPRPPELWMADQLEGPWTRHPESDHVSSSLSLRRNGGGFVRDKGCLYRIAQDCEGTYGKRLLRILVKRLDRLHYEEWPAEDLSAVLNWPQPLPHHTYNRLTTESNVLEVVDRHYDMVKSGWPLVSAAFWYVIDSLLYFFRTARPATRAN